MPTFSSRPLGTSQLNRSIKRNPALFGVPFILLMVVASYGLTTFTQIKYDLHDQKVKQVRAQVQVFMCLCELFLFLKCIQGHERARTGVSQEPEEI